MDKEQEQSLRYLKHLVKVMARELEEHFPDEKA
jgi:hypothetical protein